MARVEEHVSPGATRLRQYRVEHSGASLADGVDVCECLSHLPTANQRHGARVVPIWLGGGEPV